MTLFFCRDFYGTVTRFSILAAVFGPLTTVLCFLK